MADQEKSDSRNWKLGKPKERDSESRFELEEERKPESKARVRAPKKDPSMRESIVSKDRPSSSGFTEEDDNRPIVPIGRPIPEKVKKPWTVQRVVKHPVTITLGTVIICGTILNTLWPRIRYADTEDPYAIVYDEQKQGVALISHFVYSEEKQDLKEYALGYDEPLAIREGRFLMGIGQVFQTIGKLREENKTPPLFLSIPVLTDLPITPETDPQLAFTQELQNSERIESIKDLNLKINRAISEKKITPAELQALGDQLQWKGKALLDSFVESPQLRASLGIDKANEDLAKKSFPEFNTYENALKQSLDPEFFAALVAVHNRYY